MSLERRNPLPPGFYWQDVFADKLAAFQDWLRRNASTVKVTKTVHRQETPRLDDAGVITYADKYPSSDWFLFQVLSPTNWEGPGFPTISTASTNADDTSQRPDPPPSTVDALDDTLKGIESAAAFGLVLVLGLFAVQFLRK